MVDINPDLITDDMMYEDTVRPMTPTVIERIRQDQMWHDIRRAAESNPTLQTALDQCIMIYKLSKEYKNGNV